MASERPILFSAPMVRAILDGRKTQTRRLADLRYLQQTVLYGEPHTTVYSQPGHEPVEVGDVLWVKETFCYDVAEGPSIDADGNSNARSIIRYRATDNDPEATASGWKPSIFMPRHASRASLDVVAVRYERLQDISHEDALAEGVEAWMNSLMGGQFYDPNSKLSLYPTTAFARLWDSINGKRRPWSSNPVVRVITFERIKQEARAA